MMEFIICNKEQAPYIVPNKPYSRICFLSPIADALVFNNENKYHIGTITLRFDDIDIRKSGYVLFNKLHAETILDFMDEEGDYSDVIVINCEGGISRSAGCAAALSLIYNDSDKEIIQHRPMYNRHVYRTILDVWEGKSLNRMGFDLTTHKRSSIM